MPFDRIPDRRLTEGRGIESSFYRKKSFGGKQNGNLTENKLEKLVK
jgi:hypothetical protein